jgi:hypothetical protein
MTYTRKYGTSFDLQSWLSSLKNRKRMLLAEEADFYMLPELLLGTDKIQSSVAVESSLIIGSETWPAIHADHAKRKLALVPNLESGMLTILS